jgi:hypothetical protein
MAERSKQPRSGNVCHQAAVALAPRPPQEHLGPVNASREAAVTSTPWPLQEHLVAAKVRREATAISAQRHLHSRMLRPVLPHRRLDTFETPPMLDAAAVVVRAVHDTMPASLSTWLDAHPNMRTRDHRYRPIKRFLEDHGKKQRLCDLFRRFHSNGGLERTNREAWEPLHQYLPAELVTLAVRQVLWEIRERQYEFRFPFPVLPLTTDEYIVWCQDAIQSVHVVLGDEREELLRPPQLRMPGDT